MAKITAKKLKENLYYKKESAWNTKNTKPIFDFAKSYKTFLSKCKTERECASYIVAECKKNGYKDIKTIKKLKTGDKVFKFYKNRVVLTAVIGKNADSLRIIGSHIDSPRLDLKPNPLYQDADTALFSSHYYGGIKKYQWVNIPLSFHAVVYTSKGKKEIVFGEKDSEPKFMVPDLLPHLAKDQMTKTMREGINGEQLNILVGNIPFADKDINDGVKLNILNILFEKYGIKEKDFLSADIEFTPADKAIDIGFDSSMIAAYGQDDRSSVYTSLVAQLENPKTESTTINFFVDKEETGSDGNTGATSTALENFIRQIMEKANVKKNYYDILEDAYSLSGDVTAALNPNFPEVNDKRNSSQLGFGVSVEKFGGGGGKYSTNDSSTEYMSWLTNLLDKNKIVWQTGELGKIDIGGGGTIAKYMSRVGMECIDVGCSLLSMHSNSEISSKADIYNTYLAYKAFFKS